jgi:MtN3 and saliva related transmembrane protein
MIGLAAAICTTAANLPQLDISLNMLLLLASGLGLWVVYGALREDIVIILANGVSRAAFRAHILKLRGPRL